MYSLFDMSGQFKQLYFRGGCKNPAEFLYRREIESWYERRDLNIQLTVDKGDETLERECGVGAQHS